MARDGAQPDDPRVRDDGAGPTPLSWELTLPGISDRFLRAEGPNRVRWLVSFVDGRWVVIRFPASAAPEPMCKAETLDEAKRLAEQMAEDERAQPGRA